MSSEQRALEHINSLERGADREDKQVIDPWMCMQQEGWGAGVGAPSFSPYAMDEHVLAALNKSFENGNIKD
jgi:hypothetical protein